MRYLHLDRLQAIAGDALQRGARVTSPISIAWDVSGKCTSPVSRTVQARRSPNRGRYLEVGAGSAGSLYMDMELPCRKCAACLAKRAYQWRQKALRETGVSQRTWFFTLTLAPEWQQRHLDGARRAAARKGEDLDCAQAGAIFLARHAQISRELTLWLKRMRKASSARIRYLLVCERHKSGLPHYHGLLHESPGPHLTKRCIQGAWRQGFSNARLVSDPSEVAYVTKYLSKSIEARVRASIEYGENPLRGLGDL